MRKLFPGSLFGFPAYEKLEETSLRGPLSRRPQSFHGGLGPGGHVCLGSCLGPASCHVHRERHMQTPVTPGR